MNAAALRRSHCPAPTGLNNRAQVLQLLGRATDALSDLNHALELLNTPDSVARQSYVQRGGRRLELSS